jgi:deoxyribonuclease V
MNIKQLHNWQLDYKQAVQLQKELAEKLQLKPMKKNPRTVAGIDCAFSKDKKRICAAIVIMKLPDFELVESVYAIDQTKIPYIPGLLSFREAPVCIMAAEKIKNTPDLFLVDGQGIAHPRKLGIASHLGLFLQKPTIGCAKSRLTGSHKPVKEEKGSWAPLIDKGQTIGAVLRTRSNVKPLFVSPGNKCSLQNAIDYTLTCCDKFRLPEPARLAHKTVTELKNTL